jgi:hypothetical protein
MLVPLGPGGQRGLRVFVTAPVAWDDDHELAHSSPTTFRVLSDHGQIAQKTKVFLTDGERE